MSGGFLAILDEILGAGVSAFSPALLDRQAQFVLARQQPDGGFPGRRGRSDSYYTDFALRVLALVGYRGPALAKAGAYLATLPAAPQDIIDLFSRLHAARLLRQGAVETEMPSYPLPAYAPSAYHTFLAALCCELQGMALPAATALTGLQRPDGGFGDTPAETAGQTNATAAAMAVLRLRDELEEAMARRAIGFLAAMQGEDGGLRAHAAIGASDLLSTFTGLLTLLGLDAAGEIDLAGIARFTRALALPTGGFLACAGDDEADIEYTYYGLATLALLRAHLAAQT